MNFEELSGSLLFAAAALLGIVYIVVSMVLRHHWNKYGYDTAAISRARTIYYIGSGILMAAALFSALFYSIQ